MEPAHTAPYPVREEERALCMDEGAVKELVRGLRVSFAAGRTRDLAWRRAQLEQFLMMMVKERDEFCRALKLDLNKSPQQSYLTELNLVEHDCQHALDHLEEWAAAKPVSTNMVNLMALGSSSIMPEPLGVVCIHGTWNYPMVLSLQPMVGAIAAGNCVLLKAPSPKYSKHSAEALVALCSRYLDPTCIRVIGGDRAVTASLLRCRFDHVFLTGSVESGRRLARACAETLTPCTLELGGKSPCLVDRECDVEEAARRATWGALMNAGQTCIRPDYLLVHEAVAPAFVSACVRALRRFHSDADDAAGSEFYGRLVNEGAWDRLHGLLEPEVAAGRVAYGGEAVRAKRYIQPTIVDYGSDWASFASSPLMQEEVFGPLLPVVAYTDVQRVLDFINGREKPLVTYVFSHSSAFADRVLASTSSGSACVNDTMIWMSNSELPFGGVGQSGYGGAYHGAASFDLFSHRKSVMRKS